MKSTSRISSGRFLVSFLCRGFHEDLGARGHWRAYQRKHDTQFPAVRVRLCSKRLRCGTFEGL